jgi:DNA polymerase-3 subunit delta
MDIKPDRLAAQLAAGPLRPAWLVASPEPLLLLEAADAIRVAARAQGITEREIFEAEGHQREPDWKALEASFRAPSLFATRRLVEIRLPTGKPGKEGEKAIMEFCADPPADVCLLVTCGEWSMKHGGKWSQAVGQCGATVIGWAVKPHELADWIDRRLRSRGLSADRDAVQRLAERVEGNLLAAAQEIDKLALLSDGSPLDAQRMDALVADAARFDVFRLLDAAMNAQPALVSRMLAGLRGEGDSVLALLGMVIRELQRCAAIARVQARGGNLAAEFRAQQIWESRQAAYRRALARHPAPRWERFVAEAALVDRIAKGRAAGDAWVALERLLLAVADPGAQALLAS